MISYAIPKTIITDAVCRANKIGDINNSLAGMAGRVRGRIGELVFDKWLRSIGIPCRDISEFRGPDFLVGKGMTVDVKTQSRTVPPKGNYSVSIAGTSMSHQKPDYFMWISIEKFVGSPEHDYHTAWITGGLPIDLVNELGVMMPKGAKEPNGMSYHCDTISISMDNLMTPTWMSEQFTKEKEGE